MTDVDPQALLDAVASAIVAWTADQAALLDAQASLAVAVQAGARQDAAIAVLTVEVARLQAIIDAGTPPPPPPPPVGGLRWPVPALTAPTTIDATGGNVELTAGKDYIVRLPSTTLNKPNGVTITGGRNVVVIGGHITIPSNAPTGTNPRRALYLVNQTGTVHIEGLLIDNQGGGLSEGIQINAPDATIQIQKCRITGIHEADLSKNHPDLVQFWGGVKELRIDRLSGSSDYQGLMLKADYRNSQPKVTVSRVNIWAEPASASKYLVWVGPAGALPYVNFEDVWVVPATGRALGKTLWPEPGTAEGPTISDGVATYLGPHIHGQIRVGARPGGDFVPAGSVGLGYVA